MHRQRKIYARQRPLKLREWTLGFLMLVALGFGGIGVAQSAASVSLKHNSLIEGQVITLGDVFAGLNAQKAAKILGPAPRPGQDMVLNARTLLRIAKAMDLQWRPVSVADNVTLSRAATLIPAAMIEKSLKNELAAQGLNGKFEISHLSGPHEFILPSSEAQSVEIENLSFDSVGGRFEALVVAPSKANPIVREQLSGRIQRLVDVPVLKRPLKNGAVIRPDDLDFIALHAQSLNHNMILSAAELVGMTPRRMISAGQPMSEKDIQAPQIVQRGEYVTMLFESGALSLTAQGKALESGAKGDVIRVVNASSSKTLQARVSGQKEVTVTSF